MSRKPLDFAAIERAATANLASILHCLVPNGKTNGHEYVALNPKRPDRHLGSFRINLHTGRWADFACADARGNGVISLVAYLCDVRPYEAALHLSKQLGVGGVNHD